ncbi:hypothetical protein NEFER01_0512 [Nematocida sp. LUAm1]|nr:hypothetical protein NEFER02_0487 [Nematocida sp. LUAm2]KAI5177237.1 hypothetical protein NEFER01_0512 [Nematocida sp. LUAm1]
MIIEKKTIFLLALCFLKVILGSEHESTENFNEVKKKEIFDSLMDIGIPLMHSYSNMIESDMKKFNELYKEQVKKVKKEKVSNLVHNILTKNHLLEAMTNLRIAKKHKNYFSDITIFILKKIVKVENFKEFELSAENIKKIQENFFIDILFEPLSNYYDIYETLEKIITIFKSDLHTYDINNDLDLYNFTGEYMLNSERDYFMLLSIYATLSKSSVEALNSTLTKKFESWNYLFSISHIFEIKNTIFPEIEAIYKGIYLFADSVLVKNQYKIDSTSNPMAAMLDKYESFFGNNTPYPKAIRGSILLILDSFLRGGKITKDSLKASGLRTIEFILSMHPLGFILQKYKTKYGDQYFPMEMGMQENNTTSNEEMDYKSLFYYTKGKDLIKEVEKAKFLFRAKSISITICAMSNEMQLYLFYIIDMFLVLCTEEKENEMTIYLAEERSPNTPGTSHDLNFGLGKIYNRYSNYNSIKVKMIPFQPGSTTAKGNWFVVKLDQSDSLDIIKSQSNLFSQDTSSMDYTIEQSEDRPHLSIIFSMFNFITMPIRALLDRLANYIRSGIVFLFPIVSSIIIVICLICLESIEDLNIKKYVKWSVLVTLSAFLVAIFIYSIFIVDGLKLLPTQDTPYIILLISMWAFACLTIIMTMYLFIRSRENIQNRIRLINAMSYILYMVAVIASLTIIGLALYGAFSSNPILLYKLVYSQALLVSISTLFCAVIIDFIFRRLKKQPTRLSGVKKAFIVGGIVLAILAIASLVFALLHQDMLKALLTNDQESLRTLLYGKETIETIKPQGATSGFLDLILWVFGKGDQGSSKIVTS